MNTSGHHGFDQASLVGTVSRVQTSSVQLALPTAINGDTSGTNGHAAGGSVGEFVVIVNQDLGILGQLIDIQIPEAPPTVPGTVPADPIPQGIVQLFHTIEIASGRVCRGVLSLPRVGSKAYAADPALVQRVAQGRDSDDANQLLLNFARLSKAQDVPVSFTPEMLFARHCAILGTTGSGKSWSVARMVEEVARHNSKAILFDATGEFSQLEHGVRHVHLGNDPRPREGSEEVCLPYYHLTEGDLFAIFRPSGQSQGPKLRAAMKSLKLARLSPGLAIDGTIVKADREKVEFEAEYKHFIADLEHPFAKFDMTKLTRQIENECVKPVRSVFEPTYWGGPNGIDHGECVPLITRIEDMLQSENLAPIFDPGDKTSLYREIKNFLEDDELKVLRISLEHLSFDHHARELIANATGRFLLKIARSGYFKSKPLLVIVDEAHQFINKEVNDEHQVFALDSFALIAKEGRKYALNICLATQRPRDIPEGVLSQVGTLIVHRLISDRDRAIVERACGEFDRSALETLPMLAPGNAVMVGVEFPIPLAVQVEAPQAKPHFEGPQFQSHWR